MCAIITLNENIGEGHAGGRDVVELESTLAQRCDVDGYAIELVFAKLPTGLGQSVEYLMRRSFT